ncbi:MAG TPA: hypothetical protein VFJ90_02210, partial [Candidatus Didemnitutus sp.]|nr:hypothetical protein [Candidatus Didemnitutus sp.]
EGRVGGGYYYLQIDDDVATKRGYTRDDLTNQAWVLTPTLSASLALTPHFKLIGRAQEWHDGSVWLETKYYAALQWDLSRFIPHGVLEFSIESTQYNLSGTVYHPANPSPGYLPILPWDDDRLLMLSIAKWW